MKKLILTCFIFFTTFSIVSAVLTLTPLNPQRIEDIAQKISHVSTGYAVPISDRIKWESLASEPQNEKVIKFAEQFFHQSFPAWSDSIFLIFKNTGERVASDRMMSARVSWLSPLVVAECLENKGRFLPLIDKTLNELCNQPTWVLAAHDPGFKCFYRTSYIVDLSAATMADMLGQTLFMLEGKLNQATETLVRQKLDERIFQPVLKSLRTLDNRHTWLTRDNNWNLVCVAGVTSAALSTIKDVKLKAEFTAAAEKYIQYGINGFYDDGYCVEGVGYYSYGFGYFVRLREALYRATNGWLDLFDNPKIAKIATFGYRSEIINQVYPAVTDCRINTKPSEWILWYCNRALDMGMDIEMNKQFISENPALAEDMIKIFSNSPCRNSAKVDHNELGIRTFFDKAGFLTCRPGEKERVRGMGVAIKGGNNNESHNHNDIGSFTIVCGNEVMMGDMGGPTAYTNKTFGPERYTLYPSFGSYGHPLPVYDGGLQIASANAKGVIIEKDFTDEKDQIAYDISSAYQVKGLKKAVRSFEYDRKDKGVLVVTDQFEATCPISFETAITTRCKVKVDGQKLRIIGEQNTLEISIESPLPCKFEEETMADYAMVPFTRIGIKLLGNLEKGVIKLTCKPVFEQQSSESAHLLKLPANIKISYPLSNPLKEAVQPVPESAIFKMEGYYLWDPSVLKVGNTYHLFCSRWPADQKMDGWKKSQIIRASSKTLFGPYKFQEVVLDPSKHPWAIQGTHNPKITKVGNKYLLYYLGIPQWKTSFAFAESIEGPWQIVDYPMISTNNAALLIRADGSAYAVGKFKPKVTRDGMWDAYMQAFEAPDILGSFRLVKDTLNRLPGNFEMEDPTIWWANNQYNVICTDWEAKVTGVQKSLIYYTSKDGIYYDLYSQIPVWSQAEPVPLQNGQTLKIRGVERPQVYTNEKGAVVALLASVKPLEEGPTYVIIRPVKDFVPDNN